MTSISRRAGFTLIELLVTISMVAVIVAALSVSVSGAQKRARIEKATAEVKMISQAVLAAENFDKTLIERFESPQELSGDNVRFLIGKAGTSRSGEATPAILLASLSSGNAVLDPWGKVYRISIRKGSVGVQGVGSLQTGFTIPNLHRLSEKERR